MCSSLFKITINCNVPKIYFHQQKKSKGGHTIIFLDNLQIDHNKKKIYQVQKTRHTLVIRPFHFTIFCLKRKGTRKNYGDEKNQYYHEKKKIYRIQILLQKSMAESILMNWWNDLMKINVNWELSRSYYWLLYTCYTCIDHQSHFIVLFI